MGGGSGFEEEEEEVDRKPPRPPTTTTTTLLNSRAIFTPQQERERNVPSTLLRACSAAQLLQHFPLAEIVFFNEHAKAAFRPRFFICFPQTRKKENRREEEKGEEEEEVGEEEELEDDTHTRVHEYTHRDAKRYQVTARCFVLSIQSQVTFINPENHWSPVQ